MNDILTIVTPRALICRAAQKDSLRWWDDESLTPYAPVILDRLFPRTGRAAALHTAMEAARARYAVALPSQGSLVHLFALDDATEAALATADLSLAAVPPAPVTSLDGLRGAFGDHLAKYEVVNRDPAGPIEIRDPWPREPLLRARALASAHLEAQTGAPVFPFIRLL